MRGDQEIVVVVRRQGELLVMRRAPERLGYWSLVAGGVEPDEKSLDGRRARAARGDRARGAGSEALDLAVVLAARRPPGDPGAVRAGHRACHGPRVRRGRTGVAGSRRSTPSTTSTAGATSTRRSASWPTRRLATRCAPALRHREGRRSTRRRSSRPAPGRRGSCAGCSARCATDRVSSSSCSPSAAPGACRASCATRSGTRVGLGRRARALDVLHCTTFRGPLGSRVPTVVTVHDLAILRAPEAFPRWHRLYGRAGLERVLRAADAVVAVSEFTRAETIELAGVPAERIRVVPNGVDPVFTPDGRARRRRLRARGRDARAAQEPRSRRRRLRARPVSSSASSALAGGEASRSPAGSARSLTPSSRRCTAAHAASSTRRCTRASGFPCSRRWRAATPVVTSRGDGDGGGRRWRRRPRRSARRFRDRRRASGRRWRRRDELVPPGIARAREFTWERAADSRRRAVARARVKVVVFDADVLGRQRTGDETYALNLLRELGPLAPEAGHPARRRHAPSGARAGRRRAVRAPRALAGAPHGLDAPARASRARRRSLPHAARAPAPRAVPVRRHGPRRLVRARPRV